MYQLKIQLVGIDPPIWRKFAVPADITMDRLHDVIQIVMGWEDEHLHSFRIGNNRYEKKYPESELEEGRDSSKYRLCDLINRNKQTFQYLYDFGDSWNHKITLEDKNYSNADLKTTLACIKGKRACPPEDVGGVPGYYELLEALANPKDPEDMDDEEYDIFTEVFGDDFDAEEFDMEEINKALLDYLQ